MDVLTDQTSASPSLDESPAREFGTFFTPDYHVAQRIDRPAFLDFHQLFLDTIRDYFAAVPKGAGFDLQVACALVPGRRALYEIESRPAEHLELLLEGLLERLHQLPVPVVRLGPVAFMRRLCVWGGAESPPHDFDFPWKQYMPVGRAGSIDLVLMAAAGLGPDDPEPPPADEVEYWTDRIRLQPDNAFAYGSRADFYKHHAAFDEALADYSQQIKLDPGNANAYAARGETWIRIGEYQRAVADYDRALDLDPGHVFARCNRAEAHRQLGQFEQAIADATEALRANDQLPFAYMTRGSARHATRNYSRARADFTDAIALLTTNPPLLAEVHRRRGEAALDAGRPDLAREDFDAVVHLEPRDAAALGLRAFARQQEGDAVGALADCRRALELQPNLSLPHVVHGEILAARGDLNAALAAASAALKHQPDLPAAYLLRAEVHQRQFRWAECVHDCTEAERLGLATAKVYLTRGNAHLHLKQTDQALADFSAAIPLRPDDPRPYISRANLLRARGDVDAALADLSSAASLAPDHAGVLFSRGTIHLERGDSALAVEDFTNAIRLDPRHRAAYFHRGEALLNLGENVRAIDDLTEFMRFLSAGQNEPPRRDSKTFSYWARACLRRGVARAQAGDLGRAISDFTLVARLDPDHAEAFDLRGYAHKLRGDLTSAVADWSRVIALQPDNAAALGCRGEAYRQLGELDKARADLDAWEALTPESAELLFARGWLALQAGDWKQVVIDLGKAVRRRPGLARAHYGIGRALVELGKPGVALKEVVTALKLTPDDAEVCGFYAWLRLTCADERYRDVNEAVAWATRAGELTGWREPSHLDTLAAAHAARGEMAAAVSRQRQAINLLPRDRRADSEERLKFYQAAICAA